jgi:hypothetical protein
MITLKLSINFGKVWDVPKKKKASSFLDALENNYYIERG